MIYSYPDTLLDKWTEWSESFLSTKLLSETNDLNSILGTSGSDNPSRAVEFFNIGLLDYPLTASSLAYDSLRNDNPVHSEFGYISYLISKAKGIDGENKKINNAFKSLCAICLVQQYEDFDNGKLSLNSIFLYLLKLFPIPAGCEEKIYFRYLTAAMFCELYTNKELIYSSVLNKTLIELKIIERRTNVIRAKFNNSNNIIDAIDNKVSLTGIEYEKGSVFFIGDPKKDNPRGLFYLSYSKHLDFLNDCYNIEIKELPASNPFEEVFIKNSNYNIIESINKILLKENNNINYLKVMKTLEEGCLEAIKILGWDDKVFLKIDDLSSNTIFFGSPGTGKSHEADRITNGKDVQKVTFHPDYDYHSFVGGYKPTMDGDKIAYKFVPQIFTKIYVDAWENLVSTDETKPYYLQIEEINRGNCAEIFGDLFQLLDRDKDGYSKYEVTAEEELCKYLLGEKGFGGNHPGIENGKLRFPNNLKIIATMNTSDQSLFPMDSAFKRRWDWIYVPIDTDCKYSDFTIQLDNGKAFEWLSFLKIINEEIFEITKSQDKQIGNWFIDAQNSGKVISESTFVNKVIFYLWNDVFKDEENTIFKTADGKNLTYTSFFENGTSNNLVSYILEERLKLIDVNKAEPTTTGEE